MMEMGPLRPDPTDPLGQRLTRNPWTWNLNANMLYVEHGVGVGFSYSNGGNVQLDDKAVFQRECPAGADVVGSEFVGKVREIEQQFAAKLEEIYSTMSDSVLQGLRRRLPVTRTKFDWDKLAVAKLAGDLQKAAAVS